MKKLTQAVFDLPECPVWAESAAVDASGIAYWWELSADSIKPLIDRWIVNTPYTGFIEKVRIKRIGYDFDIAEWNKTRVTRGEK